MLTFFFGLPVYYNYTLLYILKHLDKLKTVPTTYKQTIHDKLIEVFKGVTSFKFMICNIFL